MPRIGRHPLKQKSIKQDPIRPSNITITTIVYIPSMTGYWSESFDVLKLFFKSLVNNTNEDYDLMVFDNGSCDEVIEYLSSLKNKGLIQYLILSEKNFKKLGALNYLLQSAPGKIISYADSDIYFLKGWLQESLKILDTFPEAAKVTAIPIAGGDTTQISNKFYKSAIKDSTICVKTGKIIEDKFINAHMVSIEKSLAQFNHEHNDRNDTLIERNNTKAYISTADFQFTIRKKSLINILPLLIEKDEDYYDPIYSPILERKLDDMGWWQLSTEDYLIHHMGNRIPNFSNELNWLNKEDIESLYNKKIKKKNKVVRIKNRILRGYLQKINIYIYKLLYE